MWLYGDTHGILLMRVILYIYIYAFVGLTSTIQAWMGTHRQVLLAYMTGEHMIRWDIIGRMFLTFFSQMLNEKEAWSDEIHSMIFPELSFVSMPKF